MNFNLHGAPSNSPTVHADLPTRPRADAYPPRKFSPWLSAVTFCRDLLP